MRKIALALAVCLLVTLVAAPVWADTDHKYRVRRLDMVFESTTVRVNQERTLYVEITPYYAEDKAIAWTSSNPEVVMVDGDGTITGISPGTAVITATSVNGKTATCTLTVPASVLTGIEQDVSGSRIPSSSIEGGEILYAYKLRADVESAMRGVAAGEETTLTYSDKTTLSMSALRSAAFAAEYAGGTVRLRFQTTGDDGVQGQMIIRPALATEEDVQVRVAVYTQSAQAQQAAAAAASHFGTAAAAVHMSHSGAFGMQVEVAAQVNLAGVDASALRLYHYSAETGSFTALADQSCRVDDNGYVHFNTTNGGMVVIV